MCNAPRCFHGALVGTGLKEGESREHRHMCPAAATSTYAFPRPWTQDAVHGGEETRPPLHIPR